MARLAVFWKQKSDKLTEETQYTLLLRENLSGSRVGNNGQINMMKVLDRF